MAKVAVGPTEEDAELLLELVEMTRMELYLKARSWWFTNLRAEPPLTLEEFERKHPWGSEGDGYLWYIASFWETCGALVRRKLLNEQLFFDRFTLLPYWDRVKKIIKDSQKKYDPSLGEHFEWLARREAAHKRARTGRKAKRR